MELDPVIRDLSIGLSFKPQESCNCTCSYGYKAKNMGLLIALLLCILLTSIQNSLFPLITPLTVSAITADTLHYFTKSRTKSK